MIVDARPHPGGTAQRRLSGWHAVDLAAQPLLALVERNDLDPALIEDVVMGCTMTVGEQAMNIARNAALAAGFPDTVPGTTVDRQCGSAQQAVHFAAQAVMAGAMDIVMAGGVESMSRVPIGSTTDPGPGEAYGPTVPRPLRPHPPGRVRRGDRPALEGEPGRYGRASPSSRTVGPRRTDEGRFKNEIIPLDVRTADAGGRPAGILDFDEGVRRDTTSSGWPACARPSWRTGRSPPAPRRRSPTARPPCCHERGAGRRARAAAPGPVPRLRRGRQRSRDHAHRSHPGHPPGAREGRSGLDDIDIVEINEAFASVVLAWERELHPDMHRVNPNGGAIAIGHPTGCSGRGSWPRS